jgi:hypothetical protein
MNCVVLSGLYVFYGNIFSNLKEIVRAHCTRRLACPRTPIHFNHEQRALYLDTTFQNFVQGNLSVTDY